MMTAAHQDVRDRVGSAFGAVLVQAMLACLFIFGLSGDMRAAVETPLLRMFNVLPPPPPPEPKVFRPPPREISDTENQRFTPDEEGGASPPNLRSQATEIVAPEPVVRLPPVSPVVTATKPKTGFDPTSGAADVRGPGTGSGGQGDGSGSGMGGGGGGGGYGGLRPPRLIRGRFRDSDYPAGLGAEGIGGTVSVIFTILTDGRAVDCEITRSSGSRVLDDTTCRIIEQRYFFEPSRDGRGRAIVSRMTENHSWIVEDLPPERGPPPRRRRGL